MNENYKIELDLDRDRIKSILYETYKVCSDTLKTEFIITVDEFVSRINSYLDSNRVCVSVLLNLPSRKYPEMKIEINLRRKKVIARMINRKEKILLNRYLTKL